MAHFKIEQSFDKDGPCSWYWSLYDNKGHLYHLSPLFHSFIDCAEDLASDGIYWMDKLNGT